MSAREPQPSRQPARVPQTALATASPPNGAAASARAEQAASCSPSKAVINGEIRAKRGPLTKELVALDRRPRPPGP
jgi:hypothetical protein